MYVNHLAEKVGKAVAGPTSKQAKQLLLFKTNLLSGIAYYTHLLDNMANWGADYLQTMRTQLDNILSELYLIEMPIETEAY
jgi:hypothetical protein